MSEPEVIFLIAGGVMCFIIFGLGLANVLFKSESQKRIEQTEREADELIKQAQAKLEKRERLDTEWGEL